ncbi:phage tail sheath family protein [Reyranella sp.]|uniref:phage tail sheath family protein n=1 Tax=Reyranella sp. TaxID=1929291 RepID=UPI003BADAF61
MPPVLLQPGVYIEEIPSGVRTITGVATSITLFVGWAPRGPTDRAVRLTSFADYQRAYNGLDPRSLLGYAVRHFYDNGGADAYVLRIADASAVTAICDIGDLHIPASSAGAWANQYSVRLERRPDDATRFSISIIQPSANNAVLETFTNLSMTRTDPRFVLAVINGRSAFIDRLTTSSETTPGNATVALNATTNGVDGTVIGPADGAFQTALTTAFDVGGVIDRIDLVNIVCVPGLTHAATIATLQRRVHDRRAFLIVDCDELDTVSGVVATLTGKTGSEAENSALFFPWVQAPDPLQQNAVRAFPPCGFMAGIFARTDATRGVWKAPAGTEASLTGAAGLAITMSDAENGQLNPHAVNCLRTLPVYGTVGWGARTLDGDDARGSEWKYVPVRRMALFLEESLYRGTQWVVFEPNDEPLWAQIRLNIGAFLQGLFRQGAFQGTTPRQAYFVKCDRETTTQADINLGIVNIFVGFAPLKPAEFVVLKIQQIAGDLAT